jgi:hypothetical protein
MKQLYRALLLVLTVSFGLPAIQLELNAGGGLNLYGIPSLMPEITEINTVTSAIPPLIPSTSTTLRYEYLNLAFGFAIKAPVTLTAVLANGWGLGGTLSLGYGFYGGPRVYRKDPPNNYDPLDYSYFYNYFLGIFDFTAKMPKKDGFGLVMGGGLIIRPGSLIGYYQGSRILFTNGNSSNDYRASCYIGPSVYIGLDKQLTENLLLTPLFRVSPEFSYFETTSQGGGITQTERTTYMNVSFSIEVALSWYKLFGGS